MDVTVFEDVNFAGRSEALEIGGHRLFTAADMNDEISSIQVPPGLVALVYEHADGVGGFGRSVDLMEDQADLGTLGLGDTISYIDVFAAERDMVVRNHGTGGVDTTRVVWARGAIVNGQYVAGHWEAPRAQPQTPGPPVVSPGPLPHLLHITTIGGDDRVNPTFDTSSPDWAAQVAGNHTFDGSDSSPFEWVSVLNPTVEQDDEVALAGFAVAVDLSGTDLPFTHPFGGDFEFGVVPDPSYEALLATANRDGNSGNDNIKNAFPDGRRVGLPVTGALPMEVEAGMIPEPFRASVGDRVAMYGRWIVDAGHSDFHSEIHPPLLMARARAVDAQDASTYPGSGATTLVQLWSRPYQAAQKFVDGDSTNLSLQSYLKNIADTLSDIKAYPPLFPKPFDGVHLVSFVIRPPALSPPRRLAIMGDAQLECSYSFTTNKSCGVQVQQSLSDPQAVEVTISLSSAGYPNVPQPSSTMVKYKVDDLIKQIPGDLGTLNTAIIDVIKLYQSKLGLSEADVYVRQFDPVAAPDLGANVVPFTPLAGLPPSSVHVDDTQPFPVLGWVKLRWTRGSILPGDRLGAVLSTDAPGTAGPTEQPAPLPRIPLRRPQLPT